MTTSELVRILMEAKGVALDESSPLREAAAVRAGDDEVIIAPLIDGRHAVVHAQPETGGVGITITSDQERIDETARGLRFRGDRSAMLARIGVDRDPAGRSVR